MDKLVRRTIVGSVMVTFLVLGVPNYVISSEESSNLLLNKLDESTAGVLEALEILRLKPWENSGENMPQDVDTFCKNLKMEAIDCMFEIGKRRIKPYLDKWHDAERAVDEACDNIGREFEVRPFNISGGYSTLIYRQCDMNGYPRLLGHITGKFYNIDPQYTTAMDYYYKEEYEQAVSWARKAASNGSPHAQTLAGVCYFLGLGVARNPIRAEKYFIQAIGSKNKEAIKPIQILLSDAGLYKGTIDGVFGGKSIAAFDSLFMEARIPPRERPPARKCYTVRGAYGTTYGGGLCLTRKGAERLRDNMRVR